MAAGLAHLKPKPETSFVLPAWVAMAQVLGQRSTAFLGYYLLGQDAGPFFVFSFAFKTLEQNFPILSLSLMFKLRLFHPFYFCNLHRFFQIIISLLFLLLFRKKRLFEMQSGRKRGKDRERSSSLCFNLQMAAIARARPGWSQEPGVCLDLPCGGRVPKLGCFLLSQMH